MNSTIQKKVDYEELDKHLELIPLTYDKMFKSIFLKNKQILKKLILSLIEPDIDPDECRIEILNNELPKDIMKEYQKVVDIYVLINGIFYVNLEINRSYYNNVKYRNLVYDNKNFGMLLEKGTNPRELTNKQFIQINLNTKEKNVDIGEDKVIMYGLESKKMYFENKYILIKYLEYYRDLYYNKNVSLSKSEMWLVALTSRTFTELEETIDSLLTEEEKNKFIEDVIRMSGNKPFFTEWEKEQLNELVEYQTEVNAVERGLAEGIAKGRAEGLAEGRAEGRAEGKEEKTIELIRKMLKENISLEVISKITEKSPKEIKEIGEI